MKVIKERKTMSGFYKMIEVETDVQGTKKTTGYSSSSSEKDEAQLPGLDFLKLLTPHIGKRVRVTIEVKEDEKP